MESQRNCCSAGRNAQRAKVPTARPVRSGVLCYWHEHRLIAVRSGFWPVPAAYFPCRERWTRYLSSLASPSKVPLPDRLRGTSLHSQALPISPFCHQEEDDYENPISIHTSSTIPSAGFVSWMLPLATMRPKCALESSGSAYSKNVRTVHREESLCRSMPNCPAPPRGRSFSGQAPVRNAGKNFRHQNGLST
jgi:hypothetical protein